MPDMLIPDLAAFVREQKDRFDIQQCLLRYTRGVDRHDRELMLSAYWPDAFDEHGLLALSSWEPQVDAGSPTVQKEQPDEKTTLLHISATDSAPASWRSRITLDKGRYRFHGRVQYEAIASELASRMGGSIELSSKPGETVFTLLLPRADGVFTSKRSNGED